MAVNEGIRVLEEKHMVSIILHLLEHDGCTKTDLYNGVSKNPRMPDKLDLLESAGLVRQVQRQDSPAVTLMLTDAGRGIAECLAEADRVIRG